MKTRRCYPNQERLVMLYVVRQVNYNLAKATWRVVPMQINVGAVNHTINKMSISITSVCFIVWSSIPRSVLFPPRLIGDGHTWVYYSDHQYSGSVLFSPRLIGDGHTARENKFSDYVSPRLIGVDSVLRCVWCAVLSIVCSEITSCGQVLVQLRTVLVYSVRVQFWSVFWYVQFLGTCSFRQWSLQGVLGTCSSRELQKRIRTDVGKDTSVSLERSSNGITGC